MSSEVFPRVTAAQGDAASAEAISGWLTQTRKSVAGEKQAVHQNINEAGTLPGKVFPHIPPKK